LNNLEKYGPLVVQEITSAADEHFNPAYDIYVEAFPETERHTREVIEQRLSTGQSRLFVGMINNEVVLMSLLFNLSSVKFILLDYMAVSRAYRGQKIGERFLQFISAMLKKENKFLVMEVEDPGYGDNKDQRVRRINFYKRSGAKILKDVNYILPSLNGTQPTEMQLMLLPASEDTIFNREIAQDLILRLYKEVYNRDKDDVLLNSFINKLPATIELV